MNIESFEELYCDYDSDSKIINEYIIVYNGQINNIDEFNTFLTNEIFKLDIRYYTDYKEIFEKIKLILEWKEKIDEEEKDIDIEKELNYIIQNNEKDIDIELNNDIESLKNIWKGFYDLKNKNAKNNLYKTFNKISIFPLLIRVIKPELMKEFLDFNNNFNKKLIILLIKKINNKVLKDNYSKINNIWNNKMFKNDLINLLFDKNQNIVLKIIDNQFLLYKKNLWNQINLETLEYKYYYFFGFNSNFIFKYENYFTKLNEAITFYDKKNEICKYQDYKLEEKNNNKLYQINKNENELGAKYARPETIDKKKIKINDNYEINTQKFRDLYIIFNFKYEILERYYHINSQHIFDYKNGLFYIISSGNIKTFNISEEIRI